MEAEYHLLLCFGNTPQWCRSTSAIQPWHIMLHPMDRIRLWEVRRSCYSFSKEFRVAQIQYKWLGSLMPPMRSTHRPNGQLLWQFVSCLLHWWPWLFLWDSMFARGWSSPWVLTIMWWEVRWSVLAKVLRVVCWPLVGVQYYLQRFMYSTNKIRSWTTPGSATPRQPEQVFRDQLRRSPFLYARYTWLQSCIMLRVPQNYW